MIDIKKKYSSSLFEAQLLSLLAKFPPNPLIVIQGGYGKKNLGDDALLLTIREKVLSLRPDAKIVALCHNAHNVEELLNCSAVSFKDRSMPLLLLRCDMLIIGGGGIVNIINTYSGNKIFKIFDLKGKFLFLTSLFTKLRRKPVIFYGIGMTSVPDQGVAWLVNWTMKKVDLISVRDNVTLNFLRNRVKNQKKLFLVHDPAFDFNYHVSSTDQQELKQIVQQPFIAVSIRSVLDEEINNRVLGAVRSNINYILKEHPELHILILPVSMHDSKPLENDYIMGKQLYDGIQSEYIDRVKLLDRYLHPGLTKEILSYASVIVMSRLHGLILSYEYNIPTVVLSYDTKVTEQAKMCEYPYILEYDNVSFDSLNKMLKSALEDLDLS